MMVSECDSMIRTTIPAVRIAVAKLLKSRYKMGQQEIAKRMGITQAAVSKYVNGNYSDKINRIVTRIKTGGSDKKIARMIISGKDATLVNERIDSEASAMYLSLLS